MDGLRGCVFSDVSGAISVEVGSGDDGTLDSGEDSGGEDLGWECSVLVVVVVMAVMLGSFKVVSVCGGRMPICGDE